MELLSLLQSSFTFLWILFGKCMSACDRRLDFKCDNFETYEYRFLGSQPILRDTTNVYIQCCNLCASNDRCASFNYDMKTHLCSLLPTESEEKSPIPSSSFVHGKFVKKIKQTTKNKCRSRLCRHDQVCVTTTSGNGYVCLKGPTCSTAPRIEHMTAESGLSTLTSGQANYSCDIGYQWENGSGHSVCTGDKGWTKPTLICKEIDCGHPPAFDSQSLTTVNSTQYPARVEYTCDFGYNRIDGTGASGCQANGTWSVPTLKCQEEVYWEGWLLVFRAQHDIGTSVYSTWTNDVIYHEGPISDLKPGCISMNASLPCERHYKSRVVTMWETSDIKMVKVLLLKDSQVRKEILFDGVNTNKMSWFSADHVISSSWTDIMHSTFNFFSIEGNLSPRRFFINHVYGGCNKDVNWLTVIDGYDMVHQCPWDIQDSTPKFMFSKLNTSDLTKNQYNFEYGDVMAILVK